MLKSIELAHQINELKNAIKAMINEKKPVNTAKEAELKALVAEYATAKAAETAAKGEGIMNDAKIMNRDFNSALRKFLAHKDESGLTVFWTKYKADASGQNGAVTEDGGATIPEELLQLVENDKFGVDLRAFCTPVAVHSRSGRIPIIDYSQDVKLVSFDENSEIAQTKSAFSQAKYTLASKGAIIPVSNELMRDSQTDIVGVITTLFNRVYVRDCNSTIIASITKAVEGENKKEVEGLTTATGIDAIKETVIKCPLDAGKNAKIVMNQTTFSKLAIAKDDNGNYLLTRDANNETIPMIEGRDVIVVEDADLAADTIIVGDFRTIYHVAFPDLEVQSSEEAGFTKNSVLVRAIARYEDLMTYGKCFTILTNKAS